jgi:uncharacterized phage protein (TIGR02218 family)
MRNYPPSFGLNAAGLALCWRLFRKDGRIFGFTQHDADLTFGGIVHAASSGLDMSQAERGLASRQTSTRLIGSLTSSQITETDIASGFYDQARIETWLVNWSNTNEATLVDSGVVGLIERSDLGFVVEVRSLADQWQQPRGRLYQALCAADLGDEHCKISLQDPRFMYQTSVIAADDMHGFTTSSGGYASGLFTAGLVRFLSGANTGVSVDIRTHSFANTLSGNLAFFSLWRPLPAPLQIGDQIRVTAGCDKQIDTCRTRFANHLNYRGFPRMPGNDVLMRRVSDGTPGLDGGSLFQ